MIPSKVIYILTDLLPMIILFCIVVISLRIIYAISLKEKVNFYNEFKILIYIIYTFILFKLVTTTDFESFSNNFIPFKEILRYQFSSVLFFRNVIGNILLFVPFGYMVTDMISKNKVKFEIFLVISVCLITSFSIELIQMNIGRSFDVDDIILNFLGSILGYVIFKLMHLILKHTPKFINNGIVKSLTLIIMIILAIAFVLKGV